MMIALLVGQELIISVHWIVRIYNERNTLDDCDLFKCYVVLRICASTRGETLELVPDASSKYFVYSLRKFI